MKKIYCFIFIGLLVNILFDSNVSAYSIKTHNIYSVCDSASFIITSDAVTGLSLVTHFGDGVKLTTTMASGYAKFNHKYAASGIYTVKHVLFNTGVPIDSLMLYDTVNNCKDAIIRPYLDNNGNCLYDTGDDIITMPYTVEIDSAGIFLRNITTTSFYNAEIAPSGTVYTYKIITPPAGTVVTCPISGIVYDTVNSDTSNTYDFGFTCPGSSGFDLGEKTMVWASVIKASAVVLVTNNDCTPIPATLTMSFSPKYVFVSAYPTPASVIGNIITWNFSNISSLTYRYANANFEVPSSPLILGDTVHSSYLLTPTSGDIDISNNTVIRVDTVKAPWDPNEKYVSPTGNITAGTNLKYDITFENTGNAPAENIHVQDTLSDNLDINSFKLTGASANVYTHFTKDLAGHNVIKFDFPGIHLLDTSHHGECEGMVSFSINSKSGLPSGTKIRNRVGIYFDANEVVMTGTVENMIGYPTGVSVLSNTNTVSVYPNPVNDILTISTINESYNTLTVTNTIGQTILTQTISTPQTNVNVKALPSGMYYITLRGEGGVKVQKFEKL